MGKNIPKPDLDSGIQIIEIKQNDKEINNQFYIGSDNQKQKQSDNSFFGSVGSFFKDAVDTVSKNLNEVKFSETIINAGNAMIDFAKRKKLLRTYWLQVFYVYVKKALIVPVYEMIR